MPHYIFLTNQGTTFQPDSTSPTPQFHNAQMIGTGSGDTAQQAFENLQNKLDRIKDSKFDEFFAYEIDSQDVEYLG